jgi:hypothetical protein
MGAKSPWILLLAVVLWAAANASGGEKSVRGASPVPAQTNGLVRELQPGRFAIGQVVLDQAKRTITFPAVVNLREGPIEYLLVTDYGKIHESLLRTTVPPHQVQLALVLLGVTPRGSNAFPRAKTQSHRSAVSSADMTIDISWTAKKRTRRTPAGDHIRNLQRRKPIGAGRWVFVGSRFREDGFAAQADGSIITMIDDSDAIIGSALAGADDDDNWLAAGVRLPPMDSPVELILTVPRSTR